MEAAEIINGGYVSGNNVVTREDNESVITDQVLIPSAPSLSFIFEID
jgi:hypothetical protein